MIHQLQMNTNSRNKSLKIRVLDIEFFSVDEMVHESRVDRRGNKRLDGQSMQVWDLSKNN